MHTMALVSPESFFALMYPYEAAHTLRYRNYHAGQTGAGQIHEITAAVIGLCCAAF